MNDNIGWEASRKGHYQVYGLLILGHWSVSSSTFLFWACTDHASTCDLCIFYFGIPLCMFLQIFFSIHTFWGESWNTSYALVFAERQTIAVPLPAMAPQDQCQVWLISRSWVMTVLGLLLVFLECCYCALPYVFWMPGCLVNIAVIVDETIFRKCDLWLKQSLCLQDTVLFKTIHKLVWIFEFLQ